ncbi:NADH-quinone oxidoreductase subunit N [Pseudonocardia alaniniphila]|uniref:NADH-quinone oxidoreductase subunit N n=1 Tax=Pseudonocardia alaniniphila TaxID=75291 RepID=A0ABS9TND7_9PSEU|nr:NADH-quinone oxidoreductase subunit N [Pseudonocardia alaniniphila]MCH6170043.1 NADH-quinone oxidoreductase subunit N [Pseudonocardia alaniniphila]
MTNENPAALIPELALLCGAVLGLLVGAWLPRRRQRPVRLLAAAACVVGLVATGVAATAPPQVVFGSSYAVDTATNATRAIVLVATLLALWLAADTVDGHPRESEFSVLLQLGALGTILLAGAADLLLLFAAFLLASVPMYGLAGWAKAGRATEAAMKYYLSGAFAGVAMLAGTALLYAAGGATGYAALRAGLGTGPATVAAVGLVAVLAGLAFKASAVPAHFWVPDVTDGTPAAVAAVITTIPKIGALAGAYRLLDVAIPEQVIDWPLLLAVLSALSMTLGNLAAFFQSSVQRLLAYSTVSQVGYLLIAVSVAGRSAEALPGLLFYLAGYAVTNLGAFAVVAALPAARTLDDYRGLARRLPGLAAALVVCLLGLVGTPPTAVFLGKLTVFTAAIDGGFAWLAVLAVVNTVASVFYYLRWIAPAFRGSDPEREDVLSPAGIRTRSSALTAAALSLLLGIAGGAVLPVLTGSLLG